MPGQKRRYNVRFPPKRIKKMMQKHSEVGRISMVVPVIIAQALEMFLRSLLTKTCMITRSTLSTVVSVANMKQCIESEKPFHFLKDLVKQATSTANQKDKGGIGMWSLYSTKHQEISVRKQFNVGEMALKPSHESLDNDSSSTNVKQLIDLEKNILITRNSPEESI